jgi:nicotinamidase-related amidase
MAAHTYDKDVTALLVIDPYNDFISEGGKLWDRIRAVAEANDCVPHMLQVLNAARSAKLRVFYAMHHRYRPGDYETWKYIAPIQKAAWRRKTFEYGTSDPDGNGWLIQEVTARLPGRVDADNTTFTSSTELAAALRRAAAAHGEHEKRTGQHDENWPDWYAEYMVREQAGKPLPS